MKIADIQRDKAAVLLIDLQEKMMPPIHNKERVIKNAGILIKLAELYDLPLFYCEQYPKGLGPTVSELKERLDLLSAYKLEKSTFTAALPEMLAAINNSRRQQLIIAGVETHVCVFQTVRDLVKEDYEIYIPWDAVSSRDEKNKDIALAQFRRMHAHITSTETVLFDLIGDSLDPNFRTLQALIK